MNGLTAANAYMTKLSNRGRAILDQVFDELEDRKAKKTGDLVARLADQALEDPMAFLDWIFEKTKENDQKVNGALNGLNINNLYLNALQQINERTPVVVDASANTDDPW